MARSLVCFAPFVGKSRVTIMQAPTSVGLRPAPCEFEERKVKESEGREGRRKRKDSEGREDLSTATALLFTATL